MDETRKFCSPKCKFFRCGRKALGFKSREAWCRFADDACDVKTCKFAQCVRNKLLPNGVCELTVRAKPVEPRLEEMVEPIRLPGKLAQKLRERELY